ncbi:MAG: S1 family peptidase [Actinomycetota bacterium]|nr:S1 family peptidase [Actinomycetota bacterium]
MLRILSRLVIVSALAAVFLPGSPAQASPQVELSPFHLDEQAMCEITKEWTDELVAGHRPGTWAKMEFEVTDDQLARLGLPSKEILTSRRYAKPTLVTEDGRFFDVPLSELRQFTQRTSPPPKKGGGGGSEDPPGGGPTVMSYGGTGCMGIRPGALLLLISGNSIGWCSMAHVYGSPGSYDISTAGHCGKTGDPATVIAALGNRDGATGVVLLDFGRFGTSHDGGLGDDWALIDIASEYQSLVTPTMCFWGGPRGMYTNTGSLVGVTIPRRGLIPNVSVTPDPTLAQTIVHYGHGVGVGAGGTPRAGEAIHWGTDHFMFSGAIAPGDSGSGANTVLGDTIGANMEAAGIITHIWIDPLMRSGIGIMGGTRATQVSSTLADGQIVPYPIPITGLP